MASGAAVIPYELYQDEQTTKIWKTGTDALAFVGSGLREEKIVYGVLTWTEDMLPSAPVGSYSDLVTATVNF
jgi:spore coat protein U-like protein